VRSCANASRIAAGVAVVDQRADVLALEQLHQNLEPGLAARDRRQVEVRRDHGQMRKGPLAALYVILLGRSQLEQVADRGRQHVLIALEMILVLREAAERARDVGGDGRFLGDDQGLGHGRGAENEAAG